VTMLYKETPWVTEIEELDEEALTQLRTEILKNLPEQPSEHTQLYNILGMYKSIANILYRTNKSRGKR
jgi:hypothetical protein